MVVAVAHLYLAALGAVGNLNYTVPSRYTLLQEVANDHLWAWLHALAAVVLLSSLRHPYRHLQGFDSPRATIASSFGFSIMAIWAFFNMLWGVSSIRPVSLAGPGLAFIVAIGEQLLAHAWSRGALIRDR